MLDLSYTYTLHWNEKFVMFASKFSLENVKCQIPVNFEITICSITHTIFFLSFSISNKRKQISYLNATHTHICWYLFCILPGGYFLIPSSVNKYIYVICKKHLVWNLFDYVPFVIVHPFLLSYCVCVCVCDIKAVFSANKNNKKKF